MSTRWVITAVPTGGAGGSRFPAADPQRLMSAGGSLAYLVKVTVPADAVPGSHTLPAGAHSAVPGPQSGPVPLVGIAALVVLVLGVAVRLLASGGGAPGGAPGAAPGAASTAAPAYASAPAYGVAATAALATVRTVPGPAGPDAARQLTGLGPAGRSGTHAWLLAATTVAGPAVCASGAAAGAWVCRQPADT